VVVGEKEQSDVEYDRKATLSLNGRDEEVKVYGDTERPRVRDAFPPETNDDLPETTQVEWMGKSYEARLSFRYATGGQSIPVYTWTVKP